MKKSLFLGLNIGWFLIAIAPIIYGNEVYAIREPYGFWIAGALVMNFIVSHLLILYEFKFQPLQFKWMDWLGRVPLAILAIAAYLFVFARTWIDLNVFNGLSVLMAVALFIPMVFFVLFILGILSFSEIDEEKKKRERLDSVLRDMSDEDLLRLRRRLVDGTIDDSHLEDALLGEDGELLNERR